MQKPDNSVNEIQYDCLPFKLGITCSKALESLKSLDALNPLDEFDLTDKMNSLSLREEHIFSILELRTT